MSYSHHADRDVPAVSGPAKIEGSRWFERHTSWTALLSFILLFPLSYFMGLTIVSTTISIHPSLRTGLLLFLAYLSATTLIMVLSVPTDGRMLRERGRSPHLLLWLFVPVWGMLVILFLERTGKIVAK